MTLRETINSTNEDLLEARSVAGGKEKELEVIAAELPHVREEGKLERQGLKVKLERMADVIKEAAVK
jgi:hypothetical protein